MMWWQHRSLWLVIGMGFFIAACCDPAAKNSFPLVLTSSYNDTAIKDADQVVLVGGMAPDPRDSAYYPIYSLDIQNTGSEADTFKITYFRKTGLFGIPLVAQAYLQAGETKTISTYGPIPSNSLDSAKYRYLDFYVKSKDSISLFVMQPSITIHYGQSPNGAEECGSAGKDINLDPLTLKHK